MSRARRPLEVRDGARYACAGDGLCCTDAHLLGPLTRAESAAMRLIDPRSVVRHDGLRRDVLRTEHGRCVMLDANGCSVHASHGAEAKPLACRAFPLGLVGTPDTRRITVAHRCPCVSMPSHAARTPAAQDLPVQRAAPELDVLPGFASFTEYARAEHALLDALLGSDDPVDALGAPYPSLDGLTWLDAAHLLRASRDGTAFGEALTFFGDALRAHCEGTALGVRERPWRWVFERATARCPTPRDAREMLAAFLADTVFALDWTADCTFEVSRAELATRARTAQRIAQVLTESGVRADQAMAEAILCAELTGQSALWRRLTRQMLTAASSPSGPDPP